MTANPYAPLPDDMPQQDANSLEEITLQVLDMIARTQEAVQRLAVQRTRHKLSAHRASAVARELNQLGIVLGGYKYQHPADGLSTEY